MYRINLRKWESTYHDDQMKSVFQICNQNPAIKTKCDEQFELLETWQLNMK